MANNVLACAACMRRLVLAPLAMRALSETALFASSRGLHARRNASTKAALQPTEFEKIFDGKQLTEEEKELREKEGKEKLAVQFAKRKLAKIDDPFHIGQAVAAALREGKFEGALLLTEKASRTMDVVVSWNALIAYQLGKGEVKTALKTFNNMKKRGQMPNVHTFTTLFSGLMNCPNKHVAVTEAVKHYNMLLQDTRLEANIIHTNSVLRLCSRAHDLDQMLLIANTLDNKSRAPDALTYTILLEGIRHKVLTEIKDMEPHESKQYRGEMAEKAGVLWSEVLRKWKAGRLVVDERLVVAMARTYPFQEERQTKLEESKVLDLLQDMMNIPNYAKSPNWDKEEAARLETEPLDDETGRKKNPKALATSRSRGVVYAKPGTRTLGLILEIMGAARRSTLAIKYWNKLVDDFEVHPDHDNYFRMLILLKYSKSSGHIIWLLKNSHGSVLNAGHFNIALEACINDNINTNAITNAQHVLERAGEVLKHDHEEMMKLHRMYLRVALVSHHGYRQQSMRGEEDAARTAYGRQILSALEYLWKPYQGLHKHWFDIAPATVISNEAAANIRKGAQAKADPASKKRNPGLKSTPMNQGQLRNAQREVIALARNMYAAYNKLMVEKMLPEEELAKPRARAASINREIQRFYSARGEQEPNLPPQDTSKQDAKRRGRLLGAATAKDLPAAEEATEDGVLDRQAQEDKEADKRLGEMADQLAREVAPADQDLESIKRVGAEFVWATRNPMGSKKGHRMPKEQETDDKVSSTERKRRPNPDSSFAARRPSRPLHSRRE